MKWKKAAVKSYRLSAESLESDADSYNTIAKALPGTCTTVLFVRLMTGQLQRTSMVYHAVANQVTKKLNEGDLKEPLDDAIWQEKK